LVVDDEDEGLGGGVAVGHRPRCYQAAARRPAAHPGTGTSRAAAGRDGDAAVAAAPGRDGRTQWPQRLAARRRACLPRGTGVAIPSRITTDLREPPCSTCSPSAARTHASRPRTIR